MARTEGQCHYKPPRIDPSLHDRLVRARRWEIEYGGFLSNHMTHNLVVMGAAGASPDLMQWWEDLYGTKMAEKPAPAVPRSARIEITESNWRDHIERTRSAYPAYRDFFDGQIARRGISATLRAFLPPLLPGLAGAALHPLIHTGFGVDADSASMTAEGLAYLATVNQPLATDAPHTPPDPLWSPDAPGPVEASLRFLSAARDRGLARVAHEASDTEPYRRLGRGRFQHRMIAFDDPALPLGAALNDFGPIGLPAEDAPLGRALEDTAALMAAAVRGSDNEFFVIHGLTSLHAVLVLLPHLAPRDRRLALAHWWRAAMAVMVVQGFPGLTRTAALLEDWRGQQRRGPASGYRPTSTEMDWWRRALDVSLSSHDEHVPKAVYVLWRWCVWEAFTGATVTLFVDAARHLVAPTPSGKVHDNLWTSKSHEADAGPAPVE